MKYLMAANWKMYKTAGEARETATDLVARTADSLGTDREVLVFPPFTAISAVAEAFENAPGFSYGAQNFHPADEGAFTGEIAPRMLADLGCAWLLTGHSERRHVFGETDETVAAKTAYGRTQGFNVCLCIGETIEQRKASQVEAVLRRQLSTGLADADGAALDGANFAVAYEPVWAIGTGEVAGPDEIVEAHAITRRVLGELLGDVASQIRILYGGSVKPDNAASIIALDNVEGVLVGGASLLAESFARIVTA